MDAARRVDPLELWAGRLRLDGRERWALVGTLRVGDFPGVVMGVTALFLSEDGRPLQRDGKKVRRTYGGRRGVRGAAIRLASGEGGGVVLVEGVEDGLAATAMQLGDTWACCGAAGLRHVRLPAEVARVTIVRDADPTGRRAATQAARRLRDDGRHVVVLEPDPPAKDVAEVWEQRHRGNSTRGNNLASAR